MGNIKSIESRGIILFVVCYKDLIYGEFCLCLFVEFVWRLKKIKMWLKKINKGCVYIIIIEDI